MFDHQMINNMDNYALSLLGPNTFLAAPASNAYNFGTGDFTLQCWVKTTSFGTVISRKPADGGYNNGGFLLVIKNNGIVKFATDNGYGFYEINTVSPTVIRDGNWHFLTAVRQDSMLALYIDGNPVPSAPRSNIGPPIDVNNSLPLCIGSVAQWQEQFQQFSGHIDEVRVWNRALDAIEIRSAMHAPLAGSEPGLVAYYTFAAMNGTDSSPTRNTAMPQGTVVYDSPGVFG